MFNSIDYRKALTEAGIDVDYMTYYRLNEASKLKVTDDTLTGMMKFITDKYNSLDFSEIEKSSGDIYKFKYFDMLRTNVATLRNIYSAASDPGARKYDEVVVAIDMVLDHLDTRRDMYSMLYKSGNGVVQLLYASLVAGCIYSTGTLISNTIRFVTTEQDTDCQVLFDEIPGTIKHVHIKNILTAASNIEQFDKLLFEYASPRATKERMNESIAISGAAAVIGGTAVIIMLIPKILWLIREIIYSVYFTRVRVADMLGVQVDLLNTNIESLEAGRGNKKVIARQRKIAATLSKWQNKISVKMDSVNSLVSIQRRQEDQKLRIDSDSMIVRSPGSVSSGDLLL